MPKYYILILCFLFPAWAWAQLVSPTGSFGQDSIKIGEEVPYSLSIRYPADQNILFPDSTYDFSPFELARKVYTNTNSNDGFSSDSVIYYLRTFDLEPVQTLRLPVFVIEGSDSVEVMAQVDSVYLNDVMVGPDDPLQETTDYRDVALQFNSAYLVLALVILLVIIAAVLLLFGGQIKRQYKMYRLRKAHSKFLSAYERLITHSNGKDPKSATEHSLNFWKVYMEKLDKIPFTKLTTKEVSQFIKDESLLSTLKTMDRNIYGRHNQEDVRANLLLLKEIANRRYEEKIEEVRSE